MYKFDMITLTTAGIIHALNAHVYKFFFYHCAFIMFGLQQYKFYFLYLTFCQKHAYASLIFLWIECTLRKDKINASIFFSLVCHFVEWQISNVGKLAHVKKCYKCKKEIRHWMHLLNHVKESEIRKRYLVSDWLVMRSTKKLLIREKWGHL